MSDTFQRALLPAGLNDVLPPDAAHESRIVGHLLSEFAGQGYERVEPPLIEFETSLLSGAGAAVANQTFRVMDPISQQMMAVRADMTLQIARIATARLGKAPRPLRLSYAGQVLRVKGTQLRPERQFTQVGVELIGSLAPTADAEVILLAASALRAVGTPNITVDLNVPTLVPALCDAFAVSDDDRRALRTAIDRRDAAAVKAVGGPAALAIAELMATTGRVERVMERLTSIDLPEAAEPDRRRLTDVVGLIRDRAPDLMLTVDPVERRGFEYQTGLSFTLFARGVRGELGRGGRYRAGNSGDGRARAIRSGEPAVGCTLYMDTVLRATPTMAPARRVYLPYGTSPDEGRRLRNDGWVVVGGLEPEADPAAEARRLRCGHVLAAGVVESVEQG